MTSSASPSALRNLKPLGHESGGAARTTLSEGEIPETTAPAQAATSSPPGPDPLIGQLLGDFVVRERLGQGGMGIVYAGEQPVIGKRVAIKVLRPEIARDPEQVQRLLSEARAVNAIRHRGIIDIFNFGQLPDGRHYVVMEYLAGRALDELILQRGALTPTEAIDILDEVLAALGAGHEAGIIHRDLKPSNVFLVSQPDGERYVKLLDFGLAKQSAVPGGTTAQTRTDMFVGTPEYVAPEQARAEEVGPYTDLYAAGVVMFEMLTGRLPFEASSPIDWVLQHLEKPAPAPSYFSGGVPEELDALVLRMLQKDARHRPESADVIRRELTRIRRSIAAAETRTAPWPQQPIPLIHPRAGENAQGSHERNIDASSASGVSSAQGTAPLNAAASAVDASGEDLVRPAGPGPAAAPAQPTNGAAEAPGPANAQRPASLRSRAPRIISGSVAAISLVAAAAVWLSRGPALAGDSSASAAASAPTSAVEPEQTKNAGPVASPAPSPAAANVTPALNEGPTAPAPSATEVRLVGGSDAADESKTRAATATVKLRKSPREGRAPGFGAASREQLLRELDRVEARIRAKEEPSDAHLTFVHHYRAQVTGAQTAEELKRLDERIRQLAKRVDER